MDGLLDLNAPFKLHVQAALSFNVAGARAERKENSFDLKDPQIVVSGTSDWQNRSQTKGHGKRENLK